MFCTIAGGPGPWFVSLLFNTSEKCKKQTHLIAHTLPHLAVDVLNKPSAAMTEEKKRSREEDEDCWVMILKIGPFEQWANSVAFLNLWTAKTRGKMRRLERGIELFNNYKDTYRLKLWAQTNSRESALKLFYQQPSKPEPQAEHEAQDDVFLYENESDAANDDRNNISLDDMKSIFGTMLLENVSVRTIKDAHVKLEATSKRKKTEKKK